MPELVYSKARETARWSEASDREVVEGVRDGDETAFDELIGRKTTPLLQTVRRLVGNVEDARDLVQLTFLRVWQKRRRYDSRYSPNTWIYRIATNLAIDFLRGRASRFKSAEPVRHHLLRAAGERAPRTSAPAERREVAGIFCELAEELPEKQRAAFLLREVEGRSSAEVADILGCRESTVRNHLFHARRHLRRELAERYPEYVGAAGRGEEV